MAHLLIIIIRKKNKIKRKIELLKFIDVRFD